MKTKKIAKFMLTVALCASMPTVCVNGQPVSNTSNESCNTKDSLLLKKFKFLQELQGSTITELKEQSGVPLLENNTFLTQIMQQEQENLKRIAKLNVQNTDTVQDTEKDTNVIVCNNEEYQLFSCYEDTTQPTEVQIIEEATRNVKQKTEEIKKENEKTRRKMKKLLKENSLADAEKTISEKELELCQNTLANVPNDVSGCKSEVRSFMGYHKITSKTSPQYALQHNEDTYTDAKTGIRMHRGRYCIAVGTGYTATIGTKIDLVFEDGSILQCILGDVKSDYHTDTTHRFHVGGYDHGIYYEGDGSVAEFIIDYEVFNRNTKRNPVNTALNQFGKIRKVVVLN